MQHIVNVPRNKKKEINFVATLILIKLKKKVGLNGGAFLHQFRKNLSRFLTCYISDRPVVPVVPRVSWNPKILADQLIEGTDYAHHITSAATQDFQTFLRP